MILLGNFNVEVKDNHMKSFCKYYGLKNLIKQPTCYKNLSNLACIDLIMTNAPRSFQSTCVIETVLSDLHMMTLTVMRKGFKKFQLRIINYRFYMHFSNEAYRESLINKLSQENFVNNDDGFKRFCDIPFFDKELSKAIMTRTKLRNNFLQIKSEENRPFRASTALLRNICMSSLWGDKFADNLITW